MARSLVFLPLVAAAVLVLPQVAIADTATARAKLSQTTVTASKPTFARVNLHGRFSAIEDVCVRVTFVNDLLDPGESLMIRVAGLHTWFGFMAQTAPITERTVCLGPSAPEIPYFMDGRQKDIELMMDLSGSVELAALEVTVTGTRR